MKRTTMFGTAIAIAAVALSTSVTASAGTPKPTLEGRAVLPAAALAPGPVSGADIADANGIDFPLPGQPVAGISAVLAGRSPGEYLVMPDNGYGAKTNSEDFLIRAYYTEPDFKTAKGGTGEVTVKDFISFRDPEHRIGFPIINDNTDDRLLTGGDIDPESMQRGRNGDLWIGDEFGPWLLHFDADGVLLDPPFAVPGGLRSPNNPFLGGMPATHPNSRGFEAMSISPNGRHLYATLEGASLADPDQSRRVVFEFDVRAEEFTARTWQYRTESSAFLVADQWALDQHRMVVIERDGGRGLSAVFRNVYVVDRRDVGGDGFLLKHLAVNLAAIPDPDLVSLPPIHAGDVGLGDPFRVTCESIEAVHVVTGAKLLLGCDNNLPNTGRNPTRADDTELIVVKVPGLHALT